MRAQRTGGIAALIAGASFVIGLVMYGTQARSPGRPG